ncbi:hypothetical protein QAD02_011844 [Eretmocerus hayati]|uniref:Uncharacterized protein n=1 Tax=Eretmocerus hayati TaxID=131215 RepID=A0ACC2NXW5_9HYME|nr:hypothetical protein QAD02_011844 [Eretmocerus hayati]
MPVSEARRLKRKARRNLHRARVRARKRLARINPPVRTPIAAVREPPLRQSREEIQESDDDCLMSPRAVENPTKDRSRNKKKKTKRSVKQLKTDTRRWREEVWAHMALFEERLDLFEQMFKQHLQKREEKVARKEQRLARRQERLNNKVAARERAAAYVKKGFTIKKKATQILNITERRLEQLDQMSGIRSDNPKA